MFVIDPANVIQLALHLGKHDFGVIWRHADLERGHFTDSQSG